MVESRFNAFNSQGCKNHLLELEHLPLAALFLNIQVQVYFVLLLVSWPPNSTAKFLFILTVSYRWSWQKTTNSKALLVKIVRNNSKEREVENEIDISYQRQPGNTTALLKKKISMAFALHHIHSSNTSYYFSKLQVTYNSNQTAVSSHSPHTLEILRPSILHLHFTSFSQLHSHHLQTCSSQKAVLLNTRIES